MHPSHVYRWHRGVLFCQRCGAYSHSKPGLLTSKCRLKPVNTYCERKLKRIRSGLSPMKGGKPWPLPLEAVSPYTAFLEDGEQWGPVE